MNVLERIFARKVEEVRLAKARRSEVSLRADAEAAGAGKGFQRALEASPHPLALIAEVKKASPSQGLIRPNFDPVEVALAYRDAGAEALSVLTDVHWFQGAPEYLTQAREATGLPCLRKDFVCDAYQVYEARAWGADAVLLIAAWLEDGQISELQALAHGLGMDALVEVHSEMEAARVLRLGCPFVGVNNRDLATFKTSLEIAEAIVPRLVGSGYVVSESALESPADLARVRAAGARAVLIGTSFCREPDIPGAVRRVMGR